MMRVRQVPIAVLVFIVGFMVGFYAGRHSSQLTDATNPGRQAAQTGTKLGPWRASFRIPGSVHMPDTNPIVECDFAKPLDFGLGYLSVTVTNLVPRSYLVRYYIYGYDAKGRRVSEGEDTFAIGRHEKVLRKVFLESHASGF